MEKVLDYLENLLKVWNKVHSSIKYSFIFILQLIIKGYYVKMSLVENIPVTQNSSHDKTVRDKLLLLALSLTLYPNSSYFNPDRPRSEMSGIKITRVFS